MWGLASPRDALEASFLFSSWIFLGYTAASSFLLFLKPFRYSVWPFYTHIQCIVTSVLTSQSIPSCFHAYVVSHSCCVFLTATFMSHLKDRVSSSASHPLTLTVFPLPFLRCPLGHQYWCHLGLGTQLSFILNALTSCESLYQFSTHYNV